MGNAYISLASFISCLISVINSRCFRISLLSFQLPFPRTFEEVLRFSLIILWSLLYALRMSDSGLRLRRSSDNKK